MAKFIEEAAQARVEAARVAAQASQYVSYVKGTERLIDRRAEANRFYVALNLAIVGAIGFLFSADFERIGAFVSVEHVAAGFALAGALISYVWRRIIGSQRKIIEAKFEIVHLLEAQLPARPYTDEMDPSKTSRAKVSPGRFELRVPTLFALFHLALLGFFVWRIIDGSGVDVVETARGLLPSSRF